MRRFIQLLALVLAVLSGPLAGLRPAGPAPCPCCADAPARPCPCPAPTVPGGLACPAPVALLAAPCRQAQARPARLEPSPCPVALLAAARPVLAGSALASPGPPGRVLDRPTLLRTLRI
jgi:hypothetical protein